MRPTISALRTWNPQTLVDAGSAAATAAEALDTGIGRAVRAFESARSWLGRTHDAAHRKIWQEHDHGSEVRNVLQMIADEASDAGTNLSYARDHVLRIVDAARSSGFDVADDGTVTHPDPVRAPTAAEVTDTIESGLTTIDALDERYGSRLDDFAADLASMIDGQPDVTLPGGRTMDADAAVRTLESLTPAQIRTVLDAMPPDDTRRLIQANPHVLGNLPGVPFDLRIQANEINIRNALVDEIQSGRGEGRRARTLRDMLTPRTDPTSPIPHAGDDGLVERQFVTFVNTPQGRLVEMIGSLRPGTRNVATYVPGTGTTIDTAGGDNRRAAAELATQTNGPVFLYLDGDLPPDLRAAASPKFAAAMAHRLELFGTELDAEIARHAPGATTTYIGHSYGGSVVGTAEQLGLTPDRVIYASSAGTGVHDLPHPSSVDRYSLTFPGDPIHYAQTLPGNPHGSDPDSAPGVTRLDTGTVEIDGRTYDSGIKTHGGYWNDPHSTAFHNMVKVITGQQPDLYVARKPDVPELPPPPPGAAFAPLWWLYLLNDRADGDVDMPGPIPDIKLRLPW
ncbi:alpha/beta hydrolase [Gordonia westfalica]|uniref:Alpha/beta hydrolase n=1 Tax=Gordonia westfalica TaxID=158898 RepID=A0A1H2I720_9ACTN|nr:alpha/beta hydrolase [Gordonia westfalica]SDU39930.1 Alpha/beta hydrolase [Gordonia westfalica]